MPPGGIKDQNSNEKGEKNGIFTQKIKSRKIVKRMEFFIKRKRKWIFIRNERCVLLTVKGRTNCFGYFLLLFSITQKIENEKMSEE